MHIFTDGINSVTLSNGNLRIALVQKGAEDAVNEVGTLIVPVNQASNFVNSLANTLQKLDEQVKARSMEQAEKEEREEH